MKKGVKSILICVFLLVHMLVLFVACGVNTTKSYTFDVDTGDKIKIVLDTSDGYDLSSENPFTISREGEIQSQGTFIDSKLFQQYYDSVNNDAKAKMIEYGDRDDIEYFFWCYNSSEYNYAVRIKESKTVVLLGNLISKESAMRCFERIKFSSIQ